MRLKNLSSDSHGETELNIFIIIGYGQEVFSTLGCLARSRLQPWQEMAAVEVIRAHQCDEEK